MSRLSPEHMDTSSPGPSASGPSTRDTLTREFHAWNQEQCGERIRLQQCEVDAAEEGKTSLVFHLDGKQAFTLHCPGQYPDYESEDNFFVEADSGLQLWCNALNEYLLDTDGRLSLSAILLKGLSLYSSADRPASTGGGRTLGARSRTESHNSSQLDEDDPDDMDEDVYEDDDVGGGDDDQLEDILDSDLSRELEIARRKKRWRQKEMELRAAVGASPEANEDKTLTQIYHDPSTKNRQPKQVFSSSAASGILTNDLVSIMESANETGIDADTIHDNIFQWNVKIRNFATHGVLDHDFQALKAKFNYDFIELQLDFSIDLYPFFPPLVKVIRPRLQGSMMLRVTTMEILKLTYWNPAKDMKALLIDIKSFLQTWARLDLQSDRNDRHRYPDGAYIDIEHHLLRLALVSEIVPRANKKYAVATPTPKASLPDTAMEATPTATPADGRKSQAFSALEKLHATPSSESDPVHDPPVFGASALSISMPAPPGSSSALMSASSVISFNVSTASGSGGAGAASSTPAANPPTNSDKKSKPQLLAWMKSRQSKEEKKKASTETKIMAKGVGYSRYQQKGWDVKAYMAAQREKDKQIEIVLGKIHQELKKLHGSSQHSGGSKNASSEGMEGPTAANCVSSSSSDNVSNSETEPRSNSSQGGACGGRGGSRRKRKHSPDGVEGAAALTSSPGVTNNGGAGGGTSPEDDSFDLEDEDVGSNSGSGGSKSLNETPIGPLSDLFAVLEGSALVPFLEMKLQANSFLEICSHSTVYKCVVNIIREMTSQTYLVPLLGPLPDQAGSLAALLQSLAQQAQILLDKIGKASANGSVPKSGKAAEKLSDKTSDDRLARDFLQLSKEVEEALASAGTNTSLNGESSNCSDAQPSSSTCGSAGGTGLGSAHSSSDPPLPGASGVEIKRKSREDKAADLYKAHMKSLQLDSCDFTTTGPHTHAYMSQFQRAGTPNSQIIFRVAQEISSFSTSLPLDFSSAIFVRADDEKTPLLRAIITGPEDTPYTGGCYLFDIYFPLKYPQVAPQVTFRTTGNGTVRFNPNLYNCGKVCLSLLGTWEGAQGEQWNETSTILQVLISIQSLILCAEPYFNEPGYERLYGTPQGSLESLKYSEDVFRNNLKFAILAQLQTPPEGFEEVIKAHFFLKRHILLKELETMSQKFKSKDVKEYFLDVKRELMKLEQPPNLKKSYLNANSESRADS